MEKKYQNPDWLREKYWEEEMTLEEIGDFCGVNDETVRQQMIKHGIERDIERARKGPEPTEPNWGNKLAISYFLGVMLGDGTHNDYEVKLGQTRLSFAKSFEYCLRKMGLNSSTTFREDYKYSDKGCYHTRGGSMLLVDWYRTLSLEDIEKIVSECDERKREFIRGFYESEGSNRISERRIWEVKMVNTERDIIDLVDSILKKMSYDFHIGGERPIQLRSHDHIQNARFITEISPRFNNELMWYHHRWDSPAASFGNKWNKTRVREEIKKEAERVEGFLPRSEVSDGLRCAAVEYFGSWNEAKKSAGLDTRKGNLKWDSREKILNRLRELKEELDRSPKRKDDYAVARACDRNFGGWNKAKEVVGLETY